MAEAAPSRPELSSEIYLPHLGWLSYPADDIVLLHLREGSFEFREQALLWSFLRHDDILLDIGAHCGLFSRLASQVISDQGRILAIEPNPDTLVYLGRNVAGGRVEIVPLAISDADGEALLSLGNAAESALSSIVYALSDNNRSVPTCTLDRLLSDKGIKQAAFVKLDVEGSEIQALSGASHTLTTKAVLAFLVEFTDDNLRKSGHSARQLAQILTAAGYYPFRLGHDDVTLLPFEIPDYIEYENLIFTYDIVAVRDRLRSTSVENARRSKEIINRGLTAEALIHTLNEIKFQATQRLTLINELDLAVRTGRNEAKAFADELELRGRLLEEQAGSNEQLRAACEQRLDLINALTEEINLLRREADRRLEIINKYPPRTA